MKRSSDFRSFTAMPVKSSLVTSAQDRPIRIVVRNPTAGSFIFASTDPAELVNALSGLNIFSDLPSGYIFSIKPLTSVAVVIGPWQSLYVATRVPDGAVIFQASYSSSFDLEQVEYVP